MTISYPLAMPSSPTASTISFSAIEAVSSTRSPFTFSAQYQRHQGQLWRAQIDLPPMEHATAEEWIAWMLAQRGGTGTFLMGQIPVTAPRGVATGTPVVNGAQSSGAETLDTTGWSAGEAGILKAGDLIQLGSSSTAHLHKVLQDADSDSAGSVTLDIWPRLRADVSDSDTITISSPKGLFRLAFSGQPGADWAVDDLGFYGVSFEAVEALSA